MKISNILLVQLLSKDSITKGLEVASLRFKPDNGKERRYIIVRKLISEYPKSGGKLLFDEPTYRYSAFVSNIEFTGQSNIQYLQHKSRL